MGEFDRVAKVDLLTGFELREDPLVASSPALVLFGQGAGPRPGRLGDQPFRFGLVDGETGCGHLGTQQLGRRLGPGGGERPLRVGPFGETRLLTTHRLEGERGPDRTAIRRGPEMSTGSTAAASPALPSSRVKSSLSLSLRNCSPNARPCSLSWTKCRSRLKRQQDPVRPLRIVTSHP